MRIKSVNTIKIIACLLGCILIASAGMGVGYLIGTKNAEPQPAEQTGYAANPAYEYMVSSTAWQMSAEAHALMMQGFHIARSNIDDLTALADSNQQGYHSDPSS